MTEPRPRPRSRAPLVRASFALHAAGAALCLAAPRAWPWAVGGLVADHALLMAGCLWPRSTLLGPNLRRMAPGIAEADVVALTFDDGPDPETTLRVLELLGARGARASFFCVGRRAEAFPEVVAEIARRGHRVENHSYHHSKAFSIIGPRRLAIELDRAQEVLTRCAGAPPRWFRAPAGLRSPWLDPALQARRLELVSWTRRAFDTVSRDPHAIVRRLTRGLAPGDILLLHDGSARRQPPRRAPVLDALPSLLDHLERSGLRAVSLPAPAAPPALG